MGDGFWCGLVCFVFLVEFCFIHLVFFNGCGMLWFLMVVVPNYAFGLDMVRNVKN